MFIKSPKTYPKWPNIPVSPLYRDPPPPSYLSTPPIHHLVYWSQSTWIYCAWFVSAIASNKIRYSISFHKNVYQSLGVRLKQPVLAISEMLNYTLSTTQSWCHNLFRLLATARGRLHWTLCTSTGGPAFGSDSNQIVINVATLFIF